LDVSVEFGNLKGEAKACMGLGICEEKVLNLFNAMDYHETALKKALDGNQKTISRDVSKELVRVYQ